MRTKILFCEKCNTGLMIAQYSQLDGFIQVYNQILLNALLCAFFSIHDTCPTRIITEETGYDGWVINKGISDFSRSKDLEKYIAFKKEVWFCKIIKNEVFERVKL